MILLHVFVILVPFITALDIESEKSKACIEEVIVSAMLENMDDNATAYLFSGENVWTMNIKTHKLLGVDKIEDIFYNFKGPVESASKNACFRIYYILNAKQGIQIFPDSPEKNWPLTYEAYMAIFQTVFGFVTKPPLIGCSAAYKVGPDSSEETFIAVDGSSYHCSCTCEQYQKGSCGSCESTKKEVYNPNGVDSAELKECQGLIINDGLKPFEEVSYTSRSKRERYDKERFRMLFADRETLRYWEGDILIYKEKLKDLFGCPSSFIFYLAGALLLGFMIVSTLVAVAILLYATKIKRKEMVEESRTTRQTVNKSRDTAFFVQTTKTPGSGTKSLKTKAIFKK